MLFSIGHFSVLDLIQDKNNLAGKIISINKSKKNYDLISLGHRNQQGLFFFEDDMNKQFIINSEHGPKGGDEGGRIVAEGEINDIIKNQKSFTGKFLKQHINK